MSKEKLDQYSGKLTPEQIAAGMNAAAQNSQRLAADAEMLLEAGRYPSSASLAILSIEESGKVSILRALALAKTAEQLKEAWKDYRSHRSKNFAWIMPDLVARGARTLDQLLPIVDPYSGHPQVLDEVKQLGFYTDCLGGANWSTPSEAIGKELAAKLVGTARMLARAREITPKGVALLGPDPKTLIDPISAEELREAVQQRLREWAKWAAAPHDPEWLPPRSHQAYVVETTCRALYTLASGELASKRKAAEWAVSVLAEPWRDLVRKAVARRADPTPDPDRVAEVLAFVEWSAVEGEKLVSGQGTLSAGRANL